MSLMSLFSVYKKLFEDYYLSTSFYYGLFFLTIYVILIVYKKKYSTQFLFITIALGTLNFIDFFYETSVFKIGTIFFEISFNLRNITILILFLAIKIYYIEPKHSDIEKLIDVNSVNYYKKIHKSKTSKELNLMLKSNKYSKECNKAILCILEERNATHTAKL